MTAPPLPASPVIPPPSPPTRNRWGTAGVWALSIVLVVAAWGLTQVQKPDDAPYDSFVSTTTVGERATTRNLAVTVTRVRAARSVSDGDRWHADGTWLVVDLDAAAVVDQFGAALYVADLHLGDRTYSATERGKSARGMILVTGVPRHGSLAFELPEGTLKGTATLEFAADYSTAADGVIQVTVDLDQVPLQNEVELDPTGWAR
ncbi:hypothetical protein ACTJI8_14960 [Microbacterium sp. 22303]|uniref:hypothetical protein n=1 Tax=Microbacterium sp. 22303 TaxID=3453905 RepID=UPI003F86A55D